MIVPILIAIAALAARSVIGAAYVGCLPPASIPSTTSTTTGVTLDGCFSFCDSSAYAFYQSATSDCSCGSVSGSSAIYTGSQDSSGACAADEASGWLLHTAFSFEACYESTGSNTNLRTTFPDTPEACFASCATYGGAAFSPVGGRYVCQCATDITGDGPEACPSGSRDDGGFYLFKQAIEPQPTGGNSRRQLKERRRRAEALKHQYCPTSLTACVVGSDFESFECVDLRSDLESCGGCMNGLYGPTAGNNTTIGKDCSAIPNVALGGVTCSRGQCEVSACKYGYALVNNQCIRML
ncbi:uncharacterized protein L201_007204 [Kwoniella dendrophila CBS 6074]|uniref:Protein CPL1-like domain-containing protein n=1 Tax=Kwoniella dendrophila CBS 6074 TaxID=1295534 RepID=A0AAX4K608_9TREE